VKPLNFLSRVRDMIYHVARNCHTPSDTVIQFMRAKSSGRFATSDEITTSAIHTMHNMDEEGLLLFC